MAKRIENYYFVTTEDPKQLTIPEKCERYFSVGGKTPIRTDIVTSPIVKRSDNEVTTYSGSIYELGKMSPDYKEYLEAVEKNIPIVTSWNIEIFKFSYFICGKINNEDVKIKIVSQEGNFIISDDSRRYFVDWLSLNSKTKDEIRKSDCICNDWEPIIFPTDFKRFAGVRCRPNLHL